MKIILPKWPDWFDHGILRDPEYGWARVNDRMQKEGIQTSVQVTPASDTVAYGGFGYCFWNNRLYPAMWVNIRDTMGRGESPGIVWYTKNRWVIRPIGVDMAPSKMKPAFPTYEAACCAFKMGAWQG